MKKVMFIPAQTGLAHIWRSYEVALELAAFPDMEVSMLVEESKRGILPDESFVRLVRFREPELAGLEVSQRALRMQTSRDEALKLTGAYVNKISTLSPDLVVSDTEMFGLCAGRMAGVQCALMVNALALPFRSGLTGILPNLVINQVFDNLLGKVGLGQDSLRRALREIPVILPEWEGYYPLSVQRDNFHFVGPILSSVERRDAEFEAVVREKSAGRPVVYVTFGGTGQSERKFWEVVDALCDAGLFVLGSTGAITDPERQRSRFERTHMVKYAPGLSATQVAECVVSHGSQGTITSAIWAGRPVVAVPFNLDQQVHAERVEELGIGVNACPARWGDMVSLRAPERLERRVAEMPVERVVEAVQALRGSEVVKRKLREARERFGSRMDGARRAAEVIAGAD